MLADVLRSPRFLYHALTDEAGTTDHLTAPELAARVALVVASSAVVDSVAAQAAAGEEAGQGDGARSHCTPPRAREARSRAGR